MSKLFARLVILSAVSTLFAFTMAMAHEMRPAVADVTVSAGTVRMDVSVTLESLISGIDGAKYEDTNAAPQAAEYDRLRTLSPTDLEAALAENWAAVSNYFVVKDEQLKSTWRFVSVEIPQIGDADLPRDSQLVFEADIISKDAVSLGGRAALGSLILRHENAGDDAFEGLLSPGELSPPLPISGGAAESVGATFLRYIVLGVEHIIPKGLDHILFVLGLFFFSLAWRPLIWQVSAFTLAHTVTLALASLGVVTISAAIVEPLIALSIVYIAFENLRSNGTLNRYRIGVVFGFGLLHGLGFASVLGEIGLGQGSFLVGLIGFNIGVELGQLLVIAAAFAILGYWFGSKSYYRRWIANPISVLIGLVGLWWAIERVFL